MHKLRHTRQLARGKFSAHICTDDMLCHFAQTQCHIQLQMCHLQQIMRSFDTAYISPASNQHLVTGAPGFRSYV